MIRKWKEGGVKKSSQQELKEEKYKNITAVDIGRQYLDCLKEIGNEWRRSWFRLSVTILIEQKKT